MNEADLYQVILAPHISEKSTMVADKNRQFVFEVRRDATKTVIKQAVEKAFNVQVDSVQIVNLPGKVKRMGRSVGRRQDWKKAYVKLKAGFDIDFVGAQ